ncbi:S41 family peptidase [Sphingobacterium composti Ten et al. 2007 non Yoo et al. 2007]|uniref:S41 family peptidase n=1 Tax=Sphingobacterium composti TaxID=363260 RepID=UPI00135C21D6|nr:S41 family peptidase [Sphingobacterium composti Ten et al. 2007 non Yoo et al. 2007]
MNRLIYLIPIIFIGLLSCKKNETYESDAEILSNWNYSSESYLKDSTLYITKLVSLWQENIHPKNINDLVDSVKVRRFTKEFDMAEDVLDNLIQMTPQDPATREPIDRFSFLDRQGVVNEEIQNARSISYGLYVFYLQTPESEKDNADLYIRMVDLNSPAYIAGLRRGDRILSINGDTKYDYITQYSQNFRGINQALSSKSMTIKWKKPNGQEMEKSIISAEYSIDPILSNWTNTIGNKKVGYFALSSFLSLTKVEQDDDDKDVVTLTKLHSDLEKLFNKYESEGVKELIIDLRYNGGGATATAEYLANKLVPSSATNKRMYYYKLNPFVSQELGDAFPAVNFNKNGNLSLSKVYFLVTNSTASASELLINSLKPYMDVQVIGSENTYGKPVGFWGIPIGKKGNRADLFVTSFQMFNSANFGDYFNGLAPNKLTKEDYFKDFGDEEEGFIAEAIYHIKNGSYSSAGRSALAAKDLHRINNTHLLKFINSNRVSDLGMFKFSTQKLKLTK